MILSLYTLSICDAVNRIGIDNGFSPNEYLQRALSNHRLLAGGYVEMANTINFYMDESGTRRPDKKQGRIAVHGHDSFAFGGILINDEDEKLTRELHAEFCDSWDIDYPLHSCEIRGRNGNFIWLRSISAKQQEGFYESLYTLMRNVPVIGLACVLIVQVTT